MGLSSWNNSFCLYVEGWDLVAPTYLSSLKLTSVHSVHFELAFHVPSFHTACPFHFCCLLGPLSQFSALSLGADVTVSRSLFWFNLSWKACCSLTCLKSISSKYFLIKVKIERKWKSKFCSSCVSTNQILIRDVCFMFWY